MNLQQLLAGMQPENEKPTTDSSETVIISTVALIKMFKHASRGVPIEVMGLCVGRFIDQYTVYVSDVFAMPQVGQSDSVEATDDAYQTEMLQMLESVGIQEKAVGWFHSHPGYYCWLSGVDQNTQKSFEKLDPRCVAIVVDPVNSANGRLVIESFRLTGSGPGAGFGGGKALETRIVTGEQGFLRKKEATSILHGMGSQFYQMVIQFNKLGFENIMINKIQSKLWIDFVGGEPGKGTVKRLIECVKNKDYIGCDEEAQELVGTAIQSDVDQVIRMKVFG
ncbi:26S_proteasome non-ATPase regulatory subunit [Hexamita inflata]|uniref:26S proteasome non-ATPase regulatory subunit n=1 Tax=Hexamita inflata TaxID=28002 RepID=A0AA86NHD9_9EUKA|nr:26S proteasome non-ATPase regulatory subunit [Hexamita inflata]CAI9972075.1 26S proteasome non-ATPase regulatory subunit [Hexamita inflata]